MAVDERVHLLAFNRWIFPFLLELCLTSNIKSQTVPSYDQHHFGFWYSIAHPSVICVRSIIFLRLSCYIDLSHILTILLAVFPECLKEMSQ